MRPTEAMVLEQLLRDPLGALHQQGGEPGKLLLFDLVRFAAAAVLTGEGGARTDREAALGQLDFPGESLQALQIGPRILAEFLGKAAADDVDQDLVPVNAA